jgi:hypothetical protein
MHVKDNMLSLLVQEALLAASRAVESLLKGTTYQLDRKIFQALSVSDLVAQLKGVSWG